MFRRRPQNIAEIGKYQGREYYLVNTLEAFVDYRLLKTLNCKLKTIPVSGWSPYNQTQLISKISAYLGACEFGNPCPNCDVRIRLRLLDWIAILIIAPLEAYCISRHDMNSEVYRWLVLHFGEPCKPCC